MYRAIFHDIYQSANKSSHFFRRGCQEEGAMVLPGVLIRKVNMVTKLHMDEKLQQIRLATINITTILNLKKRNPFVISVSASVFSQPQLFSFLTMYDVID